MASWMDRKPKKTELESKFDALCKDYFVTFGEPYPVQWGINSSMEDDIASIQECLKTGTVKQVKDYDTSGGKVY